MAKIDDFVPVLSQVIASLPQAVMIVDAESQIYFANQAALDLFGYAGKELEGTQLDHLIHEAHRERHRQHVDNHVRRNAPRANAGPASFPARRRDGREFAVESRLTRLQMPGSPAMVMVILADISDRANNDGNTNYVLQASAGSESLMALDMIEDAVSVLDRKWRCLFVNEAGLKLNGWDKSDVLGKTYWDIFPDLIGTPMDRALRGAFYTLEKVSVEVEDTDTGRWYRVDIVPSASTLTVHSADVTERKQASDLNRRLMRSLDHISDPILMMDREWRYSFVNLAGAEWAHGPRDELLGANIWELAPWLRDTPFGQACLRAMEGGEAFTIEDYYKPRDRWLNVHYFPGPDGFTVHIADINDLKQAQGQIAKLLSESATEAQMHAVFDLMPTPMLMVDSNLHYTYANAAAMKANGRTPEMIGKQMWELNPPLKDSEMARRCREAFKTGERQQFEILLPPSGRWFQIEAIPWGDQVILEAVDISKQKQSEESVGILTQTLEQAMDGTWNRPSARAKTDLRP